MAEKDYRKIFSNLLKDMIDGHQEPTVNEEHFNHVVFADFTINDFNSLMLEDLDDQNSEFWKYLTDFMYNEYSNIGHQPIYETDFSDDKKSIVSYLSNKIDIDSNQNWASIWANLKQQFTQGGGTWNPSVNEALNKFLTILADKIYIRGHEGDQNAAYIAINDIKRGNAGNAFENALATLSGDWVRPNNNADNEMYRQVRGQDAIHSVLNSHENLQFTHSQNQDGVISAWLRLIMPKYLRTVEVEDLNRNFWVLGQIVSAISAFLFDPENSFASLFEDILSEIVQLWENVLYLWLAYMVSSQKKSITDLHIEVVPITVNEYENFIKFDNFEPESSFTSIVRNNGVTSFNDAIDFEDKIKDRCKYIIQQYGDSNIIIFPKIRYENYKHNYYIAERWPCMLLYDNNKKSYDYVKLTKPSSSDPVVFDTFSSNSMSRMWAVKEDEFTYSFVPANTARTSPYNTQPYYMLFRTIPEINAYYDTINNEIVISSLRIVGYDVCYELVGSDSQVGPNVQQYFHNDVESYAFQNYPLGHSEWKAYSWGRPGTISYSDSLPIECKIEKGYYQGEFPSYPCYRDAVPDPPPPPPIIIEPTTAALDIKEVSLVPLNLIHEDASELFDTLNEFQNLSPQDQSAAIPTIQTDIQKKFERRWIASNAEGHGGIDEQNGTNVLYNDNNHPYNVLSSIYPQDNDIDRLCFPSYIPNNWAGNRTWQYQPTGEDINFTGAGRTNLSDNDYFKSFYYYNGKAIIDSLKKKQYLPNSSPISGDCYTLYKYAEKMIPAPATQAEVNFLLLVGKHKTQLYGGWSGGTGHFGYHTIGQQNIPEHNNDTFYTNNGTDLIEKCWDVSGAYEKEIKNDGQTTPLSINDLPAIQYYEFTGHSLANTAVLYKYPLIGSQSQGEIIPYKSFKMEAPGPSCFLVRMTKYNASVISTHKFFLKYDVPGVNKGTITTDNWICLYIQVSGGKYPLGDSTNTNHPAHYTMEITKNPNQIPPKSDQTIITRISMCFLFPNGNCVLKIIDRHHGHGLTERVRGYYDYQLPGGYNQDPWIINKMNTDDRVNVDTFRSWKVKYYGDFSNNQEVFEKLYNNNSNKLLLQETIDSNGEITSDSTEHVFVDNGQTYNYHFYFVDNSDEQDASNRKFDPIKYPNTLYEASEDQSQYGTPTYFQ